jgi:uncharacterized protein (DUF2164 family)
MARPADGSPLRIRLSSDRRAALLRAVKEYVAREFDDELSDFRAQALLDFFVRELGPPVYNQGVRDAAAYLQERLSDIEGEIYERDAPPR